MSTIDGTAHRFDMSRESNAVRLERGRSRGMMALESSRFGVPDAVEKRRTKSRDLYDNSLGEETLIAEEPNTRFADITRNGCPQETLPSIASNDSIPACVENLVLALKCR
jgi:hypothetical protein